jgi:hypothetical protein
MVRSLFLARTGVCSEPTAHCIADHVVVPQAFDLIGRQVKDLFEQLSRVFSEDGRSVRVRT